MIEYIIGGALGYLACKVVNNKNVKDDNLQIEVDIRDELLLEAITKNTIVNSLLNQYRNDPQEALKKVEWLEVDEDFEDTHIGIHRPDARKWKDLQLDLARDRYKRNKGK